MPLVALLVPLHVGVFVSWFLGAFCMDGRGGVEHSPGCSSSQECLTLVLPFWMRGGWSHQMMGPGVHHLACWEARPLGLEWVRPERCSLLY